MPSRPKEERDSQPRNGSCGRWRNVADSKLQKLIDSTEHLLASAHDNLRQMKALAAGENPVGDTIALWVSAWKAKYGAAYELSTADAGNLKRLVTRHGAADTKARLARYLADGDQFLTHQRHPLSIFWSRANTYSPAAATHETMSQERPVGCRHT